MKRFALFAALLCLAAPSAAAAPAAEPAEPAETESLEFVLMPIISVPIIDAGRLDGVLRVAIVLQAHSEVAADRLSNRMPELQAAGLGAASEFARLYASPFTPVDVEKLTATLAPSLNGTDPGIAKVLIVHVTAMTA